MKKTEVPPSFGLVDLTDPFMLAMIIRASGYRRTSHKYRIVSRVDRPGPCKHGNDFYRRCNTKDKIEGLPYPIFKLIPGSNDWPPDDVGFAPVHPLLQEVIARCKVLAEAEKQHWKTVNKGRYGSHR